jgi:membrane protein required for colicin V production
MTALDWIIVAILFLSVLLATAQGFVYELFSLAGSVLGYVLAAWNYKRFGVWLLPYTKSEWVAQGVAFLLIFICIIFLAGAVGRVVRWAAHGVGLRWFDRLLGAAFGLLRGALIVMVLVMTMATFVPGSRMLAESRLGSYFLVMGRGATLAAPSELRAKFKDGLRSLSEIRNKETKESAPKSGAQK